METRGNANALVEYPENANKNNSYLTPNANDPQLHGGRGLADTFAPHHDAEGVAVNVQPGS